VSGVLAALLGSGDGSGGGGGDVIPGALSWTNIFGSLIGHTNLQIFTGITVPIAISAGLGGGSGTLHYALNGIGKVYTGAFNVSAGDSVMWSVGNITGSPVSGTVTVENLSDSGTVLDTFTYTVTGA
jgi:hypothetical protein